MTIRSRLIIAFALLLLAGSVRFYRLGDWPYAGDELATLAEEASLFGDNHAPPTSQIYRLPRMIPLSHLIQHVDSAMFGRDERGSRILIAAFGALSVPLAFLFLDVLAGRSTAIATALVIALWPEHVFQSQQTRFYMVTAFLTGLAMLGGALAMARRSWRWALGTFVLVLAATLSHTLMAVVPGIILAGVLLTSLAQRKPPPPAIVVAMLGAMCVLALFWLLYLRPLIAGWNDEAVWGYSLGHSLLGSVSMLGWPIALLTSLGFLLAMNRRNAQDWYWCTCAAGWLVCTIVFPFVVPYHPEYFFPLALGPLVLAGSAIGYIHDLLSSRSRLLGMAWIVVAAVLNLPWLVSHFADGSRPDFRTAAEFVGEHWREGDRVTGFSTGLVAYYAPRLQGRSVLSLSDPVRQLTQLTLNPQPLWVVVQSGRSGLAADLARWLGRECSHPLQVRKTRFDYFENTVDVFLCGSGKRG